MGSIRTIWGIVATAILNIAGLILLPTVIYNTTGSVFLTILTVVAVLFVLAIATFFFYIPSLGVFRSGYRRYPTEGIITERFSHIGVDEHFVATIDRQKDMLFFSEPKPDDFIDLIDTLPGHEVAKSTYQSSDSAMAGFAYTTPHQLVIYWKPKRSIKPLIVYRHQHRHQSPSPYGPDGFYHSIIFDRETGRSEVTIDLPKPVEELLAFVMPRHLDQVSEAVLYKYGLTGGKKDCMQPTVDASGTKISWVVERPTMGRRYVIFALYQGEKAGFIKRMNNPKKAVT